MPVYTGWLLDLYAAPEGSPDGQAGLTLWLLDEAGPRRRLRQSFPVTFYAAGPARQLRSLWSFLRAQPIPLSLRRAERRELFSGKLLPVLEVRVARPADQPPLFRLAARRFPDLTYYDTDIPLPLRHAALYGTFPLARCRVAANPEGEVRELQVLDFPWDLDPVEAPLRRLCLEPDCDPAHASPRQLLARAGRARYRLPLDPPRPLLANLRALLQRHDPDLLLCAWGDTWLLPRLLELAGQVGLPLPLNRDPYSSVEFHRELSYFSYGQVVHRGQQVHLFGRWHLDGHNAMLWGDYDVEGVLENARVTALPVQTAARVSPGTGISSMQMTTALRQGILVPWRKQQAEHPRPAAEMFSADQGGLVYQPIVGLHQDVGAVDFISMYPGIMVRFNISPETAGAGGIDPRHLAPLDEPPGAAGQQRGLGLVPLTLAPLLNKRVAFKRLLASLPAWDPRRKPYKARASAHKWLLVTCFGYLGYKNARFGRIEAHEAVTAYGREALLRAKEAAEDLGFTVLHLYVDGLWVKKAGAKDPADFEPLLKAIAERTGLPIALDGVYRWVAFLPSRVDARLPVANRYFGVFQDNSLKVRGIEARRRDAPEFVVDAQMQILKLLAGPQEASGWPQAIEQAVRLLRRLLAALRLGQVPLETLVVRQRLSRSLEEYRTPSPAARAATQLQAVGKQTRPGQRVAFIYLRGAPRVHAWNLPDAPDPAAVDVERYAELLLRAAGAVLGPFGLDEQLLRARLHAAVQAALPAEEPDLLESPRLRLLRPPQQHADD
jgi:DNA polymerase II